MNRLAASAQKALKLTREERALACMRDFWVDYPTAVQATELAMALVALPRGVYNPGMLVVGISGAGKSTMVRGWTSQSWKAGSRWAGRLVYVDMSEDTKELNVQKRVIEEIGKACNQPHLRSVAETQKVIRQFNIVGIIVDELGETEEASLARRWKANLLSIRGMAGERWGVNIILVGTSAFAKTVDGIDNLASRFSTRRAILAKWTVGEELAAFIKGCIRYMPLLQESPVTSDAFLETLVAVSVSPSSGSVAEAQLRTMLDLFKETCMYSILSCKEYIDETDLPKTCQRLGMTAIDPTIASKITLDADKSV